MKKSVIEKYIVCPKCKGAVYLNTDYVICTDCRAKYRLVEGILIMVNENELSPHFNQQISYFEKEKIVQNEIHTLHPWQKSYVDRLNEAFSVNRGDVVLDCGVGSSYMSVELAKQGAFVISLDLTLNNLRRLKKIKEKLGLENILLVYGNAEELPIKDSSVDYFISNAVLEHLPHEKEAISEINRVTHLNSGLSLVVPLKYRFLNPLLIPLNYIHDKRIGHLRRYDEKDFLSKFPQWDLQKTFYTGHFAKVLKSLVNMIFKVFDEKKIEKQDRKTENKRYGASNIVGFLERNHK